MGAPAAREREKKAEGCRCAAAFLLACMLSGCTGREPIRVGFAAQLTGVQADLGVQERNGVQMAMEEVNAAGGVAGRKVEVIVKDDLGTADGARSVDRELIGEGVVAIIGHPKSEETIAALEVTNPARMVMISPSVSSPALSGKDDYFFRVFSDLAIQAGKLARRAYAGRGLARMAAIYDTDNSAYCEAYLKAFADEYLPLGGKMAIEAGFSSRAQADIAPVVARMRASGADSVLIVAADIDTALIAQQIRRSGWQAPLFTSWWAQTDTLIAMGGRAVEGMEVQLVIEAENKSPDYLAFMERYRARYGQAPSIGSVMSYEAAKVLVLALGKTGGKAEGLKDALAGIRDFKGLSDTYSFDKFGDVVRPIYLGYIRDGRYHDIAASGPGGEAK